MRITILCSSLFFLLTGAVAAGHGNEPAASVLRGASPESAVPLSKGLRRESPVVFGDALKHAARPVEAHGGVGRTSAWYNTSMRHNTSGTSTVSPSATTLRAYIECPYMVAIYYWCTAYAYG